eukprot:scaffold2488_cov140-Skeletonema_menzelii.AAC.2
MSAAVKEDDMNKVQCCASCGIAGGDDIKLKKCTACHLVKYCSDVCQRDHEAEHKKECKKRAAELYDEILFKQPESSQYEDCPICCLPFPMDPSKYTFMSCCSKYICDGCNHANQKREFEARLQQKCPFCRKAMPSTKEEFNKQLMKRIEANDPLAMCFMGWKRCDEGDYKNAFEYWSKAAALGDVEAHYHLSILYHNGQGVEKDEKRALHHMEEAAISGHPMARHNLGCLEREKGRVDRAATHWIIAAKLGYDRSLENVKDLYKAGQVSKDDLATALRGHQAAVDATKSPQREAAVEYMKWLAGRAERGRGVGGSALTRS